MTARHTREDEELSVIWLWLQLESGPFRSAKGKRTQAEILSFDWQNGGVKLLTIISVCSRWACQMYECEAGCSCRGDASAHSRVERKGWSCLKSEFLGIAFKSHESSYHLKWFIYQTQCNCSVNCCQYNFLTTPAPSWSSEICSH